MTDLPTPEEILVNPKALELLRIWLSNDQLITVLRPATLPEGAVTYGMVLADIARHAADMLHKTGGQSQGIILAEILRVFLNEIKTNLGNAAGGFVDPKR